LLARNLTYIDIPTGFDSDHNTGIAWHGTYPVSEGLADLRGNGTIAGLDYKGTARATYNGCGGI
jgi:hypothetical protein